METLTHQFESRVAGLLQHTRARLKTFCQQVSGSNLVRQLRLDRSLLGDHGSTRASRLRDSVFEARRQSDSPAGRSQADTGGSTWQRCFSPGHASDARRLRLTPGP